MKENGNRLLNIEKRKIKTTKRINNNDFLVFNHHRINNNPFYGTINLFNKSAK